MYDPNLPFALPNLPPDINLQTHPSFIEFMTRHNDAQRYVSELNGALKELENPNLFLSTFFLREAISSNEVENIHTTIESALEDQTKPFQERTPQNKEVSKYRQALEVGVHNLKSYGLSSRTIKAVHKELGVTKGIPGEYRRVQNRIVNTNQNGLPITIYTPPICSGIDQLLGNWELYAANDKSLFPLLKAAICHYQFEAIHPFEDGNGRSGRILMILQLMSDEMLDYPALFISGYLSQYQNEYKRLLLRVTTHGEWWAYIEFMLTGFATQALVTKVAIAQLKDARKKLREDLYEDKIPGVKIAKSNIGPVVDHLFSSPLTTAQFMSKNTQIHWQTCSKYLGASAQAKVLTMFKVGKYNLFRNEIAIEAMKVK